MKRFNALVAAGAFLATAIVATAPAGAVSEVSSKAVRALYDSQCNAISRGDFDAVREMLAPTFTVKGPGVQDMQTRDQALDTMRSNVEAANFGWCSAKIDSIRSEGDDVVAVVEVTLAGWTDPQDGPVEPVSIRTVEEDRWAPAGSGFQESGSTQRELTYTVGGQVLQQLGSD